MQNTINIEEFILYQNLNLLKLRYITCFSFNLRFTFTHVDVQFRAIIYAMRNKLLLGKLIFNLIKSF